MKELFRFLFQVVKKGKKPDPFSFPERVLLKILTAINDRNSQFIQFIGNTAHAVLHAVNKEHIGIQLDNSLKVESLVISHIDDLSVVDPFPDLIVVNKPCSRNAF